MHNRLTFGRSRSYFVRVRVTGAQTFCFAVMLCLVDGAVTFAQTLQTVRSPVIHAATSDQTTGATIAAPQVVNQTREYNVKGVYLFNFARFVAWPDKILSDKFIIGILGESAIMTPLRKVQAKRSITDSQRKIKLPIELKAFTENQAITPCHILFVSRETSPKTAEQAIQKLKGSHTLIVGEQTDFIANGGTVEFVMVKNGIGFDLNLADAQKKGLVFNAQLLKAANRIVNSNSDPSSIPLPGVAETSQPK